MHFPIKSRSHESWGLTKEPCLSAVKTAPCTFTFRERLPQVLSSEDTQQVNAVPGATVVSPALSHSLRIPGAEDGCRHCCATLSPGISLLAATGWVLPWGTVRNLPLQRLCGGSSPPTQPSDFFGLFKLKESYNSANNHTAKTPGAGAGFLRNDICLQVSS